MAEIVIVTRQCYLVAESINHISVHEMDEEDKADSLFYVPKTKRSKNRKMTPKQQLLDKLKRAAQLYQININFTPLAGTSSNGQLKHSSNGNEAVTIVVRGYDRAMELYHDMISQIREQLPDRLFLDRMVETFFTDNPLENKNDGSTK